MDQTTVNPSQSGLHCPLCKRTLEGDDFFCSHCGYPRKGSEREQRVFILKRQTKLSILDEANKKLKQASNTLLIIGGILTVFATGGYFWGISGMYQGELARWLSQLSLGLTFIALGIWCLKRPFPAIISGFALFFIVLVVNSITSPANIFNYLFVKVAIIFFLANGIKAVFDAEKIKRDLNG